MDALGRPQDPLVSTKTSALSSAPPHMRDGTPGHLFTPMESSKPAQGPSTGRAQALSLSRIIYCSPQENGMAGPHLQLEPG